jgi:hypothetical protein
VYTARLLYYCLRVLESVENGIAEMDPDEQTESDEDSKDVISNDGGESMNDGTHNGGAETVTDVFKDARRLFP